MRGSGAPRPCEKLEAAHCLRCGESFTFLCGCEEMAAYMEVWTAGDRRAAVYGGLEVSGPWSVKKVQRRRLCPDDGSLPLGAHDQISMTKTCVTIHWHVEILLARHVGMQGHF